MERITLYCSLIIVILICRTNAHKTRICPYNSGSTQNNKFGSEDNKIASLNFIDTITEVDIRESFCEKDIDIKETCKTNAFLYWERQRG